MEAIRGYLAGETSLGGTQAILEANATALEGSEEGLKTELRDADAELERIQHAMRIDEQRAAAETRLEALARYIQDAAGERL